VAATLDAVGAKPGQHGAGEDAKQLAAAVGKLRPAVAGDQAARLCPDPLPVLGGEDELCGGDADHVLPIEEPGFGQLAHGVKQDIDANAKFIDGGDEHWGPFCGQYTLV
jgi:hypothetical protein